MKSFEKIAIYAAGSLVWCFAAHAGEQAQTKNPYATIAARNIFHLAPPQQQQPFTPPVDPPPKLSPDGIINIFGRAQVLFKMDVHSNSPGAKARESSYILAEGEESDGVRVMHIDITNAEVTFNNHGTVQQIPLVKPPVSTTETRPPPPAPRPAPVPFNRLNPFTRRG